MTDSYFLPKSLPATIFRAYDIRGIADEQLSTDVVYGIGQAFATEALRVNQSVIAVARDGRLSGPQLVAALIAGIRAAGADVIDLGAVPTPLLYFATATLETQTGIMLTGSHNPSHYNGLKMVLAGNPVAGDAIFALKDRLERGDLAYGQGGVEKCDILPAYLKAISQDIKLKRPLKVVLDAGSGIAGAVAPALFRALGCEVIELFCDVDGHFPHHHPDPSQLKNLAALIACVKSEGADVGLAFDGDGDRLGLVTNTGDVIWPDRQLMLYAADVLSRHPGGEIIYDVKCTRLLAPWIIAHGGKPLMWKTGHSFIKAKLKQTGALLAGEMSGHTFFKERWYGFDDGLYTGARLVEILAAQAHSLTTLCATLPEAVNTPELNIVLVDERKFAFMAEFIEKCQFKGATKITLDGLRVEYPDAWGLVRPSNTSPCLVLRFEADNSARLALIMAEFKTELLAIAADLPLPY